MIKLQKLLGLACFPVLLLMAGPNWAEQNSSECAAAVDSADSLNPNQSAGCDYSKSGLNGWIHKNLRQQEPETKSPVRALAKSGKLNVIMLRDSAEVSELGKLRNKLILDGLAECAAGFTVLAEAYRPLEKTVELELKLSCN